jgi:hypothetical protein
MPKFTMVSDFGGMVIVSSHVTYILDPVCLTVALVSGLRFWYSTVGISDELTFVGCQFLFL